MNRMLKVLKKEPMLVVSLLAAVISLFVTPPSVQLLSSIDWKTLATLFMLLSVLDGFKKENLFLPLIKLASGFKTAKSLTLFFVYSVFFSSMFVTNDVSLIIFVPLTMYMFREAKKEKYILPILALENIAAVRGSLLTPFGSPQNLFLYEKSGLSSFDFMKMMSPLWIGSFVLLYLFISVMFIKDPKQKIDVDEVSAGQWESDRKFKRILYLSLFLVIVFSILSRTKYWPLIVILVVVSLLIFDRQVFVRVDYVLLLTFLCFFIFSSSITANKSIADFLSRTVTNREYWSSLILSQVISNVPASIVLWPFTNNLKALLYGLDSAGLITIIGSLASVINLRLYSREYPGRAMQFMKWFEIISLAFFVIIVIPQYFICR